jgi:catechol 2,3-dioxygenase-like lactoylglutathione lyase family enzyme
MRVHLSLNVRDLDAAVSYYSKLFGAKPSKRKPGYANFALDRPPLKLALLEVPGAPERLNHLGVEVFDQADVDAAVARLSAAGIAGEVEVDRSCCHARQNKIWSADPQGVRWEFYRVLSADDTVPDVAEQPETEPARQPAPAVAAAEPAAASCGCAA